MRALERIKEIELVDQRYDGFGGQGTNVVTIAQSDVKLLLKAFKVMRELAVTETTMSQEHFDSLFEKRMAE